MERLYANAVLLHLKRGFKRNPETAVYQAGEIAVPVKGLPSSLTEALNSPKNRLIAEALLSRIEPRHETVLGATGGPRGTRSVDTETNLAVGCLIAGDTAYFSAARYNQKKDD